MKPYYKITATIIAAIAPITKPTISVMIMALKAVCTVLSRPTSLPCSFNDTRESPGFFNKATIKEMPILL